MGYAKYRDHYLFEHECPPPCRTNRNQNALPPSQARTITSKETKINHEKIVCISFPQKLPLPPDIDQHTGKILEDEVDVGDHEYVEQIEVQVIIVTFCFFFCEMAPDNNIKIKEILI